MPAVIIQHVYFLPFLISESGLESKSLGFSEKRAGKDICDRKFAQAKNRMRKYVVGGSDILDAATMHTALVTGAGKTMDACVCEVQQEAQTLNKASISKISFLSNSCHSKLSLPAMGWALKVSKPAQKMMDKVLEYLTEIFDNGVKTGKQRDATDVAREMKVLEDDNRERIFSLEERLNKQQIFTFWSRLKAQRKLDVVSTASVDAGMNGDMEDLDAAAIAIEE
ncbi:MAG: hypothetical protein GY696_08545, partial [Gammaproteobacteria bacterium]|nr:hypothetical protein [Gammaproteobacteria bacterium]